MNVGARVRKVASSSGATALGPRLCKHCRTVSQPLPEFAVKYSREWAAHDPDTIAAMHTEDSVFHLHDIGPPAEGRAGVRNLIAHLLAAVPDLRFQPVRAHFGADHFVSEYVMSGTVQGRSFAIHGADVFTIRDGLVARKDSYLDWVAYSHQTGLAAELTGLSISQPTGRRATSGALFVARFDEAHHLGDARRPELGSTLGAIDPAQPAVAVEGRESVERRLRLGPSRKCLGDVRSQFM
jgi:ketosteroid isomerase-like protein